MGNKQPKTIFTDEDQAMANAIEQVFTGTRHRLCTWHIAHNATKNISSLYANPEFRTHFNKVFGGCQSVPEFEVAWDSMTSKFNLQTHPWLNKLYNLRNKWCPAFSLDTFSANMKSTQRVESTNNVFHQMCTKTTNIVEFVLHYEKKLEDMRLTELQEDFRCKQGMPRLKVISGILCHAAEVYTNKIFKFFEIEYMSCLTVRLREVSNEEGVTIYEATEEGHKRVNTIEFISHTSMVSCSCKMYEAKGILCRHALRVFDSKYLTSIPTQYVLKRWTKTVKEGMLLSSDLDDSSPQGNLKSAQSLRLSQLMHKGNSLFSLASMSDWGAHIVSEKLSEAMKLVEKDIKAKKASDKVKKKNSLSTSGVQDDDQHILDPPTVRAKGVTNKRLKSALEKSKKVAKVRYTSKMSPPNTVVSGNTHSIWLMAVDILDNITLALQLQEFLEKCADAGNIELMD
ncbi:protein FAR1-RELATED SEQUENCE 5-like [Pyrus x bretschneideri]|nr:protein FAR1-RELATED SEQUENCE 5-like [Pyrus x bretschneideri]